MTREAFMIENDRESKQTGWCSKQRATICVLSVICLCALLTPIIYFSVVYSTGHGDKSEVVIPGKPSYSGHRMNCIPEAENGKVEVTSTICESRGCVYDHFAEGDDVKCFHSENNFGYKIWTRKDNDHGFNIELHQFGKAPFGGEILAVDFIVDYVTDSLLHFRFDGGHYRYHVPLDLNLPQNGAKDPKYRVDVHDNQEMFSFSIVRKDTGTAIWNTSLAGFVFSKQFLQISTILPSRNVYGFGENRHKSFRHDMKQTWPMFSRDQGPGQVDNSNLYGVHPFYECVEDNDGNTHGVFLLNSNAQEYSFTDLPSLTYRTIGGILDFYVFMGPTPENVIQQYTNLIGRPMMPPYWSLGFQLCRYGYNHIDNLKRAVETTKEHNIPLDVQYADIDHMDERMDFTIDKVNFPRLNDYFKSLQNNGMRTIIILDPTLISNVTGYEPYEKMKAIDGNIKWPADMEIADSDKDENGAVLGYVWPKGKVVFPDFMKKETGDVWKELIKKHHKEQLVFDGLWIDMNEPANFGTNEERPWNWPEKDKPYWSLQCGNNTWDDPPYRTKVGYVYDNDNKITKISEKTICMISRQGTDGKYKHYDVHSLYGWSQTEPTLRGLQEATGKRGIVITRSTFPSSGKYSGHWLGDNDSNWSSMIESIIGILEFNLFGIPYIGADICGFFGDTTPELCKRWMQLGAFYTFSRNHNGNGYMPQDPGSLGEDVAKASREALETRYWLLPYLYTLFHQAHTDGHTVIRPLHHEFPADENTYDIDRQFLWGSALLISPILEPNQTSIKYYLPDSTWYDFYTGRKSSENGFVTQMVQPDSKIPLHVQGGHILPLQKPANNTSFSRKNGFKLVVALKEGKASGELYWDDGDSISAYENGTYYLAKFNAEKNYLTMSVENNNVPEVKELYVEKIEIWGLNSVTNKVTLFNADNTMSVLQSNYDSISKVTSVENLKIPLEYNFHLSWGKQPTEQFSRIDCFPQRLGGYIKLTEEACRKRSCEYDEDTFHPEVPVCYFKNGGYRVTASPVKTDLGFQIPLTRVGSGPFQDDKQNLMFTVEMLSDFLIRFKFDVVGEQRYTVPKEMNTPNGTVTNAFLCEFKVTNNDTFAFQIIRKETGTVLFDTGVGGMVFAEQFLQISTKLPSTGIYGFGENLHHSFRHDLSFETWSMFSRDQPTVEAWGKHLNHYGVHPFYVGMEYDGKAHGVLLLNSNAQDYSFTPLPMLTYRTIGGILDFYIFMGPSPENVIQQYTKVIGRPMMPPYWSLGFQLCRYGYGNLDNLTAAVERTKAGDIPHDVQYADIDHYDNNKIFTVDEQRFGGLSDYFNQLREEGMSTIIILDPCIVSNETNYEPYDDIRQISGSIKWPDNYNIPDGSADTDGAMLGFVWPQGKVVFPDYFKTETSSLWKKWIKDYHKKLVFDGLWIDMNEPANFGTNEERPWNWPKKDKPYWSLKCGNNTWDDPPYRTRAAYSYDYGYKAAKLSDKTLCLVGRQGDQGQYSHYDVHSLYGWSQTMPTFHGLQEATGERGIVVTRSTFVGSGQHSGHWLGDNRSTWEDLRLSIIGMLEFNLFGIPYIGADICGYFDNTNVELCKRWMQLGAFYPYSRNHNGKGYIDQDPGALGEDVVIASREALRTRYQLLPYLYTLFHQAHVDGNTVVRPLHHEFPDDKTTYGIQEQFMWGRSLLISPILYPLQTKLKMYKPNGVWYDFYSKTAVSGPSLYKTLDISPDSRIPLHIRAGSILCLQDYARNTRESRKKPMRLLVALDNDNDVTNGELFWDDGVSIDTYENGNYHKAEFEFKEATLSMKILHSAIEEVNNLYIETIEVMGFPNHNVFVRYESENIDLPFTYEEAKQILVINHRFPLSKEFTIVFANFNGSHMVTKEHYSRINCYPEVMGRMEMINQSNCQARGCLYDSAVVSGIPHCFFKTTNYGYMINGSKVNTDLGYQLPLIKSSLPGPFPGDLDEITFEVQELDDHLLRVKIFDENKRRFEVPLKLTKPDTKAEYPRYMVKYISNDTFSFQIIRKSTGTVLFDTSVGGFTFADQFLQISTKLPSTNIYGFGENVKDSFRHNLWFKSYPMFSRDQPTNANGPLNHYGVHPFYTVLENDGNSHGVFILNSNAQEYSFTPLPMLTYRTIGGILDLYFFLGPEPENVIQQYTTMIGKPYMPPYWSLGFQLSRFGYDNLDEIKQAVARTREAGIPHDVQMADIDHMDQRKDFTVDDVNFAGLKDYFNELRFGGMRTIIILDPALLAEDTNYEPYERIKAVNGYVKWPVGASIPPNSSTSDRSLLGSVWPPGKVVFPDFFNENTTRVWSELIAEHSNLVPFDGIWIDMNEPANFETNNEGSNWTLKCTNNTWDDPPYRTMAVFVYDESRKDEVNKAARLSDKTICMNTVQGVNEQYRHYDVHSLYGWSQTSATLQGIRQANNNQGRGLVLSRSTFPGSGASSVHWLGDNESTWKHMKQSITGLLDFNLFGIPFIGADICGFFGDTTPELCKRWMQLGAFYTFSRNHNGEKTKPQDPGALGEDVAKASREALETRYWLLPYLYTLFHQAHTDGHTVIRPLHHEFPTDSNTYGINTQFLWGPALLISPILHQNQKSISYYLPGGRWYDFYTGEKVTNGNEYKNVKVTGDSKIPLHVRGGYILPLQEPANNTRFSREKPFKLLVAMEDIPGRGLYASGKLFWDDGDSIDTYENGMYLSMYFECFKNRLDIRVQYDNMTGNNIMVDNIEILGVENWMNYVHVNGREHNVFTNNQSYKKLLISNLRLKLAQNTVIEWSQKREGTQEEYDRIDCLPDANKYTDVRTECTRRNCIWRPVNDVDGLPACYIDNSRYGYTLISTSTSGTETFYHLQWRNQSQMFTGDLFNITLVTDYINDNLIRFKLFDPSSSRYEVPINLNLAAAPANNPKYEFIYELDKLNRFSFKIKRRSTGTTIFDTSIGGLTFADQFLQLATRVPSQDIYGFGENRHFSLRHDFNYKRWPMFSRDQAPGWGDYGNLYGVHPFYTCIEDDQGNTHGVLLLNSNAMEIGLQPSPAITYRTIGGVLDFYMFLGPEPEAVIQQYTNVIGRPYLPPYWSLGFQLCRYGYNSLQTMREAVDRTIAADIPFDVQYADIDHMDERMDFTIDEANFDGLSEFVRDLQDRGMRFIIILDPAIISNVTNYRPYELGLEKDIYIKWPSGMNPDYAEYQNDNVLGYVWPKGKTVFPDFLNPNSSSYWSELIVDHFKEIPYDGLWIDMNEPANFGTNEEKPFNWPVKDIPYWSLKCPTNKWDDPPYKPTSVYGPRLSEKTVCMISLQNNGVYRHYDVHSLYGWSQTEPTLRALQTASGKRGMVISRSTYPGSGRYSGHWLGDNDSSWNHLYDSIIGIIEFNLFGIPYIGADICGFFGDSNPELCERWMQLGAFYTYNRNHNGLNNKPQDPAAFGPEVAASSRKVLRIRYSLLPYLYTLFFNVNQHGGTVIRGLFHEFPTDQVARKIETQFLWGSSFMVAPIYLPGVSRREVYFPGSSTIWYDYYTGNEIRTKGGYETVPAPRDTIPLFIRGGSILPTQHPANTTMFSRLNPFKLIVAPDNSGMASGTLFWDDGEGIGTVENDQYFTAEFKATTTSVTMVVTKQHNVVNELEINSITIFNVPSKPLGSELIFNGGNSSNNDIQYNSLHKVLKLSGFKIPLSNNFTLSWILTP